ncbi:hypothetical protein [Streptomyces sp. MST-110588]|uniref:hypothetical protein n=1 Tax=Streptomyces sp. MST-110588 TaxID=2833628 RepID=UPI001F5DF5F0|nr:hypothetical protein [Streptomyces sp. MST-110588]UNO42862.1 hypothetical protein KGS77_29310 [Streptomyces sp. MST-110588]
MAQGAGVRRAPALAAAVLLVVAGAAGCSDASDDGQPAPSGVTSSAGTHSPGTNGRGTPGSGTTTGAPGSPGGSAPADPAAARRQIEQNWQKFFDPKLSNSQKAAYLENGADLAPLLAAFNEDRRGQQVAAKVTGVRFTASNEADVTYTLTLKGATALPDAKGVSVLQDKVWKVSVKTLCALVAMSGDGVKAPGC